MAPLSHISETNQDEKFGVSGRLSLPLTNSTMKLRKFDARQPKALAGSRHSGSRQLRSKKEAMGHHGVGVTDEEDSFTMDTLIDFQSSQKLGQLIHYSTA